MTKEMFTKLHTSKSTAEQWCLQKFCSLETTTSPASSVIERGAVYLGAFLYGFRGSNNKGT